MYNPKQLPAHADVVGIGVITSVRNNKTVLGMPAGMNHPTARDNARSCCFACVPLCVAAIQSVYAQCSCKCSVAEQWGSNAIGAHKRTKQRT